MAISYGHVTDKLSFVYISYECSNYMETDKIFSLATKMHGNDGSGECCNLKSFYFMGSQYHLN